MKYLLIGFFFMLLYSCKNATKRKDVAIKFISQNANEYNISILDSLSSIQNSLSEYKLNPKSKIYSYLKGKFNFYDLYYYSKIDENTYVLYYDYDYNKAFLLISLKNDKIIAYKEMSYLSGDGGDFDFKNTERIKNIFYSNFMSGERSFVSPLDTIRYRIKGKSKIMVMSSGKIKEDTLQLKRNFIEIVSNDVILEKTL